MRVSAALQRLMNPITSMVGSLWRPTGKVAERLTPSSPTSTIEWRFHNDCRWLGWGEFSLNVADIAHTMRNHRLPIETVRTADLDAATPEALAFLLAMAAKREGVRVACESEGRLTIYASRHNNLHAARHVALATAS